MELLSLNPGSKKCGHYYKKKWDGQVIYVTKFWTTVYATWQFKSIYFK